MRLESQGAGEEVRFQNGEVGLRLARDFYQLLLDDQRGMKKAKQSVRRVCSPIFYLLVSAFPVAGSALPGLKAFLGFGWVPQSTCIRNSFPV